MPLPFPIIHTSAVSFTIAEEGLCVLFLLIIIRYCQLPNNTRIIITYFCLGGGKGRETRGEVKDRLLLDLNTVETETM